MSLKTGIVAVDVDEVCADLLGEWLYRYNNLCGTALLPEDITEWDVTPFLEPGTKSRFYGILQDPELYKSILPIEGARTAVTELRDMGYRVIFVTACVPGTVEQKRDWLQRWGFLGDAQARRDYCPVNDKSLIRADYLFDDRVENVAGFKGQGVLVRRAHNRLSDWKGGWVRSLADAPIWLRLKAFREES